MCQKLAHRGPDDEGYFEDHEAHLAMRRLSIIDLETGQQPITNEDHTLWLVFNGEIYNYRELRASLIARGHIFRTQGDTEVIIHAYEEYGAECVLHFNGMFAIAIWDSQRRQLFLARDRLGIKPLYYWMAGQQLVFASELKALLCHPHVPRHIDIVALDQFLTLEYVPAPRTIFADVCKLPAGHSLRFDADGATQITQYWDIPNQAISANNHVEALEDLIRDAVRLRLVSDVPLGAFLSGGIDSSTIVAAMCQTSTDVVRTFSIGFDDHTYNELSYSRLVAQHFQTQHYEAVLKPQIADLALDLVQHFDEPFADFSIFPTFLVSKIARESVKVILSGDGGDELFAGYDTYVAQHYDRLYRRLPARLRQQHLPELLKRIPPQQAKKGIVNKAKRFVEGAALSPTLQHTRWMSFMNADEKNALYTQDIRCGLDHAAEYLEDLFLQAAHRDPLAQQQYVDIKTYLAEDILTKVDRMSMAASLEVRVPFLDHRIVEFAVNLPPAMKMQGSQTKYILRRAMADQLPADILNRPKQGFSIPLKHWLRTSLKPMMTDLLSSDTIQRQGYFETNQVERWIDEHLKEQANHSHKLWMLMVFQLWHQQVLEAKPYA